MAVKDVALGLVSLCKQGHFEEAMTQYYSENIVSVEPVGDPPETRGMAAVQAKAQWWYENHQVHGVEVRGPFLNGDQFAVLFDLDVTPKATGERATFREIGVYTVAEDKVVHERFFFGE